MATPIASQTVRVEFQRVSLVDDTIYYYEWNALAVDPEIVNQFERVMKEDPNFENVKRTVRTTLV